MIQFKDNKTRQDDIVKVEKFYFRDRSQFQVDLHDLETNDNIY